MNTSHQPTGGRKRSLFRSPTVADRRARTQSPYPRHQEGWRKGAKYAFPERVTHRYSFKPEHAQTTDDAFRARGFHLRRLQVTLSGHGPAART
jgi:hypothetical protein